MKWKNHYERQVEGTAVELVPKAKHGLFINRLCSEPVNEQAILTLITLAYIMNLTLLYG